MDLVQKQAFPTRLACTLIVIGVFARCASTSPQFNILDNSISNSQYDEDPAYSNIQKAAALSKTLANRNHTKIDSSYYMFDTTQTLRSRVKELTNSYVRTPYLRNVINYHRDQLYGKKRRVSKFAADNEATISAVFVHVLGHDETRAGQLNAQMIRHQLIEPMNVIQSLLTFTIHQKPGFGGQSMDHVIEQFKYKARAIKVVHDDFDFLLRQESTKFFTLKRAMSELMQRVNELLRGKEVPTVSLMSSLLNKWRNLPFAIENEIAEHLTDKRLVDLLHRMYDLTECTELGIAAYKECQQNPSKLETFSAHVRKSHDFLRKWEQEAHHIHAIVIPVLKQVEKLSDKEHDLKFIPLILSLLPKLNSALFEQLQLPLWNSDVYRTIEDTRQLNRQTVSFLQSIQLLNDREALLTLIKKIRKIDHPDPKIKEEMEKLNDEITAYLMLESCTMAKEALKAYVFAIDQDYLELCNIPANADSTSISSKYVNQTIIHNVNVLEEKIARENSRDRRGASYVFKNSKFTNKRPFFVWKHAGFKNEIAKILSGETVTLNADILSAPTRQNAVKFNKIIFDFRFANKNKQAEFYKVLDGLSFRMDMIGYNYYRCDNRIYYVPTDSVLSLMYTYYRANDDKIDTTHHKNQYPSVLSSQPFLSPYNTWQLGFYDVDIDEWIQKLKPFIGEEIDLHVIGVGSETLNDGDGKAVCFDDEVKKNYARDVIVN